MRSRIERKEKQRKYFKIVFPHQRTQNPVSAAVLVLCFGRTKTTGALLASIQPCSSLIVTVQHEKADRICARRFPFNLSLSNLRLADGLDTCNIGNITNIILRARSRVSEGNAGQMISLKKTLERWQRRKERRWRTWPPQRNRP
jgi:hypothetical protein